MYSGVTMVIVLLLFIILYFFLKRVHIPFGLFFYLVVFPWRELITEWTPTLDLLIDILLLVSFLYYLARRKKIRILWRQIILILGILLVSVLYSIISNNLSFMYTSPDIRFFAGVGLLCIYLYNAVTSCKLYEEILKIFSDNSCILALLGIGKFIADRFPDRISIVLGLNFYAVYLAIGLICELHCSYLKKMNGIKQRNTALSTSKTAVILTGIFLSGSKGTMLGIAFILGIYLLHKVRLDTKRILRLVLLFALLFGIYGIFITIQGEALQNTFIERIMSSKGYYDTTRFYIWKDAWERFCNHWVIGIGVNNFRDQYTSYQFPTHNDYLRLLAETGIIGSTLFSIYSVQLFTITMKHKGKVNRNFVLCELCLLYIFMLSHNYINYIPFWVMTTLVFINHKIFGEVNI